MHMYFHVRIMEYTVVDEKGSGAHTCIYSVYTVYTAEMVGLPMVYIAWLSLIGCTL